MGKVASRLVYTVISEVKSFNIEQRAQRVISQDKPMAAPTFKANLEDLERVLKDHPEIVEQTTKKDEKLDERLRDVYVTSSHEVDQSRILNSDRPLPTNKHFVGYFELGYQEPEFITPGRATLKQIIQFLGDYRLHPEEWPVERIAVEYKLDLEDAQNMVEYFKLFALQIPAEDDKKKRKQVRSAYHTDDFNELLQKAKYLPPKDEDSNKKP